MPGWFGARAGRGEVEENCGIIPKPSWSCHNSLSITFYEFPNNSGILLGGGVHGCCQEGSLFPVPTEDDDAARSTKRSGDRDSPSMQILLNGLASGSQIAALAIAFAVVYRPTGIIFFALGGIYVVAPYIVAQLRAFHCPWWASIPIAIACTSLLSLACELLNHARLERSKAIFAPHLVSSLGIYLILEQ